MPVSTDPGVLSRRRALALATGSFALAGLSPLSGCGRQWISQSLLVDGNDFVEGVPNLHQVTRNLYRSGQPADRGMSELESKLGIRHVISLVPPARDLALIEGTSISSHAVPMQAWVIETDKVVRALQYMGWASSQGPTLVHCEHGSDRTGLMVAMYRIVFQNWSNGRASDEMQHGGFGFHNIWTNIVDYVGQADGDALRKAVYA